MKRTRRNRRQSVSDVRCLCCWNQWHLMRFVMQGEKNKAANRLSSSIDTGKEKRSATTVQNADNITEGEIRLWRALKVT